MLISIVAPFYNEGEVVFEFYKRLVDVVDSITGYNFEFIFINDGSIDNTLINLYSLHSKDKRVKIINFSRNFGHQAAIIAGIKEANGKATIIIDSDLQDPPELIPSMIEKWQEGYDVIYGKRVKRKGESILKRITAFIYYRLINFLSDIKLPLDTGDFKLIDSKVLDVLKEINEYNIYLRGLIAWAGFRQYGIEYVRERRYAGITKYSVRKMFNLAIDGITSFSIKPLRLSLQIGTLSILVGLGLVIYTLVNKYLNPEIILKGWSSLLITIIFFGGVQLFTIGVMGEYIGKIYKETKKRPLYIIKDKIGFKENIEK